MSDSVDKPEDWALARIRDIFEQMAGNEAFSDVERQEIFTGVVSVVEQFLGAACAGEQIKRTKLEQPPDLSGIPLWKNKEKSGAASEYLEEKYGHLLKRYNTKLDADLICLQDLKAHDPRLYRGLYNESKETNIKPSAYMASKPQRTRELALSADVQQVQEAVKIYARALAAIRKYKTPDNDL